MNEVFAVRWHGMLPVTQLATLPWRPTAPKQRFCEFNSVTSCSPWTSTSRQNRQKATTNREMKTLSANNLAPEQHPVKTEINTINSILCQREHIITCSQTVLRNEARTLRSLRVTNHTETIPQSLKESNTIVLVRLAGRRSTQSKGSKKTSYYMNLAIGGDIAQSPLALRRTSVYVDYIK